MNHSNTHAHYPQLSADQVVADLNACNDKIEAVTGVRPTLVRLPYGDYDDNSINAVRSIGMEPIQWDVDSLDWKDLSAADITQRVVSKVQPGSIVLFHQRGPSYPGGPAWYPGNPDTGRLHLCPDLPNHSGGGLHHRSHWAAVPSVKEARPGQKPGGPCVCLYGQSLVFQLDEQLNLYGDIAMLSSFKPS